MQHKLRKEKWVKRIDWLKEKAQALRKLGVIKLLSVDWDIDISSV